MWFHRMELLSRIGVVNEIKELRQQVVTIINLLKENDELFIKEINHYYFRKWGTYTGLALEKDWRSPKRRICDLSFRCLLIIFYAGISDVSCTSYNKVFPLRQKSGYLLGHALWHQVCNE